MSDFHNADVMLKKVRLSYPQLSVPKKFNEESKMARYDASFVIAPGTPEDTAVQAALLQVAKGAWPKEWQAKLEGWRGNTNKYCYTRGLTGKEGYEGMLILAGHRNEDQGQPLLLGPDIDDRTGELRRLSDQAHKLYGGCYVNAKVQIWAQTQPSQFQGVRCKLITIQFAGDGEPFSAGNVPPSADGFGAEGATEVSSGASSLV